MCPPLLNLTVTSGYMYHPLTSGYMCPLLTSGYMYPPLTSGYMYPPLTSGYMCPPLLFFLISTLHRTMLTTQEPLLPSMHMQSTVILADKRLCFQYIGLVLQYKAPDVPNHLLWGRGVNVVPQKHIIKSKLVETYGVFILQDYLTNQPIRQLYFKLHFIQR